MATKRAINLRHRVCVRLSYAQISTPYGLYFFKDILEFLSPKFVKLRGFLDFLFSDEFTKLHYSQGVSKI